MSGIPLLLKDAEEGWRNAFKSVREGFQGQDRMAQFLRHYWIAEHKFVRMQWLYREIATWLKGPDTDPADSSKKKTIAVTLPEQKKRLQQVVTSLRESAGRYVWLAGGDEGESFDPKLYQSSQQYLSAIPAFGATQVLPLLLAILNRTPDPTDFADLCRAVEAMIVRRSLVGAPPNDVEQAIGPLCRQVVDATVTNAEVIAAISKLASENQTKDTFRLAEVDTSEARYVLLALENQVRAATKPARMPLPYDLKKIDVEHILPETTAGSGWKEAEWGNALHVSKVRIANFVLLDRAANRAAKNAVFSCGKTKVRIAPRGVVCCKRHAYQLNKDIELTLQLAKTFRMWNPASLERRASQVAVLADQRWPLN